MHKEEIETLIADLASKDGLVVLGTDYAHNIDAACIIVADPKNKGKIAAASISGLECLQNIDKNNRKNLIESRYRDARQSLLALDNKE